MQAKASADTTATASPGIRLTVKDYVNRSKSNVTVEATLWFIGVYKNANGNGETRLVRHPELVTKATDYKGRIYIPESQITELAKKIPAQVTIEGVPYNYDSYTKTSIGVALLVSRGGQRIVYLGDHYFTGIYKTRSSAKDPVQTTVLKGDHSQQFRYSLGDERLYQIGIYL